MLIFYVLLHDSYNSSRDCSELDTASRAILNVPSTSTGVAGYGDSSTNETSDWVQIVVSGNEVVSTETLYNLDATSGIVIIELFSI